MQGRRTLIIAAVVAIVAAGAIAVVSALHAHAGEQRARYEVLIELEASANRVDALESEANAERRVPLPVQSELTTLLRRMHSSLVDLEAGGSTETAAVRRTFEADRPLIEEEFALMRARDFERAEAVDAQVDFELIRGGLRRAAIHNNAVADRTDHISWLGTAIVAVIAAM